MAPSEILRNSGFCCTFCWLLTPVQKDKGQINRTGCIWIQTPQNAFSMGLPPCFCFSMNTLGFLPSLLKHVKVIASHTVFLYPHRNSQTHPSVEAIVPLAKHLRDASLFSLKVHTSTATKRLSLREFKFFCCEIHKKRKTPNCSSN